MNLTFTSTIAGAEIHCEIGSDKAVSAPVLCFSLMATPVVVSGGVLQRSLAGYAEVLLPDLLPDRPHHLILRYADPRYAPRNRVWLPLGAYLRVGKTCLPLPAGTELGVLPGPPLPFRPLAPGALPLIPAPQSWQPGAGHAAFHAIASADPRLAGASGLAQRSGLPPLCADSGMSVTFLDDPSLPIEGYRLTIAPNALTISAAGPAGVHHAAVTLLTLRETCAGNLACGTITDAPRFAYRGQHLDCARHFFTVDTILRLLDLMALVKLNHFHWHLSDDESFRLQVETAPALWQQTEFRGEGCLMPGVFGGGIRSGGSYARADVARVLAHAEALHITVIPEIEVPAHSHAMIKALPGLRDPGDNGEERSVQGYLDNIVNPGVPATWALLEPLLLEVAALFPARILHLGCDEAPPGAWSGSPAVAALKAREGLDSSDDVQGWMMARLAGFLAAKGIRPAAWEEAAKGANGGIGAGALLYSWTGQGPGIAAARRGHDVVMCPAQCTYFDLAHSPDPGDWGAAWAGFLPLEKTLDWDPVPPGAEDIAPRVIGVQGCLWGEVITEDRQIEPLLAPRILGLATKAWEPKGSTSGPALRSLAAAYAPLFEKIGWQYHSGA